MGLRESLARYAVGHAHVLVVEVPGYWHTRVATERQVLSRGWRLAESPADADVLAVCGDPGPELSEVLDRLWEQLPGPRARVVAESPSGAEQALDRAAADLGDLDRQRDDSRHRDQEPLVGDHEGHDDHDHESHEGHGDHGSADAGHDQHEGMDHGSDDEHEGMDHGSDDEHEGHGDIDHGHMHHGGMDMAPGGIPLAEGGEDRDGLEMDLLHVRLGPVLPAWPAGLVLRCTLQGDLIVEAEASMVDEAAPAAAQETGDAAAARTCDTVAQLLTLAGWQDGADQARRTRDLILDGDSSAGAALDRLGRRVSRARLLRWSLRGLRRLVQEDLDRHDLPQQLEGDVHDRLVAMLDRARRQLADPVAEQPTVPLDALPTLVTGLDLATARLVVASLDLAPLQVAEGTHHV